MFNIPYSLYKNGQNPTPRLKRALYMHSNLTEAELSANMQNLSKFEVWVLIFTGKFYITLFLYVCTFNYKNINIDCVVLQQLTFWQFKLLKSLSDVFKFWNNYSFLPFLETIALVKWKKPPVGELRRRPHIWEQLRDVILK